MTPRREGGIRPWGPAALTVTPALLGLALLLVSALLPYPALADDAKEPSLPLSFQGDASLDEYFDGSGTDGLTLATAHVLEGLAFSGDETPSLSLSDTTRHLVVRNCTFTALEVDIGTGIALVNASNVVVMDCAFGNMGAGVHLERCSNVSMEGNALSEVDEKGVEVVESANVALRRNHVRDADRAVVIARSDSVVVIKNTVGGGAKGITVGYSDSVLVRGNEVSGVLGAGLDAISATRLEVVDNTFLENADEGVRLVDCDTAALSGNHMELNRVGLYLSSSADCLARDNRATGNVRGFSLVACSGFELRGNTLDRNLDVALVMTSCFDGLVVGNQLSYSRVGLELTRSTGNSFVDNLVLGNLMADVEGDTSGNEFVGNDLHANGWLVTILWTILGFTVAGAVVGGALWYRGRRRRFDDGGEVRVRAVFPPGRGGLWEVSKVLLDEDFFQAQLESAGPQRETVLDRYKQNIGQARRMQYMGTAFMSVFLALIAFLPMSGLMNLLGAQVDGGNLNDLLFATSTSVALYFIMTFAMMLIFGVLFLNNLMKGETFRLLATLPLDRGALRRTVTLMLLRQYSVPFAVVLLSFPVGGYVITGSVPFLVTALLVNALNLVFIALLLVLLADLISSRIFSSSATRGATALRIVVMSSYLIGMMFVFVTIQVLMGLVEDLYMTERLSGSSGELVNGALSLVPFPFAGSYMVTLSVMPASEVPVSLVLTTLAGMAILVAVSYGLWRAADRVLGRVSRGEQLSFGGPGQVTELEDVAVTSRRPVPSFTRTSLVVTSRDMGGLIYLIMPVVFPLIMVVSQYNEPMTATWEGMMGFIMYSGIMPFLINLSLSSSDAEVGGLMSSLPFVSMDLYRSKQLLLSVFMCLPLLIIGLIMGPRMPSPGEFAVLLVAMVPVNVLASSLYLLGFSVAFGRVNGRFTFFMSNIERKLLKYVGLVGTSYMVVVGQLVIAMVVVSVDLAPLWAAAVGLAAVDLALVLVVEAAARRLFSIRPLPASAYQGLPSPPQ